MTTSYYHQLGFWLKPKAGWSDAPRRQAAAFYTNDDFQTIATCSCTIISVSARERNFGRVSIKQYPLKAVLKRLYCYLLEVSDCPLSVNMKQTVSSDCEAPTIIQPIVSNTSIMCRFPIFNQMRGRFTLLFYYVALSLCAPGFIFPKAHLRLYCLFNLKLTGHLLTL